MYNLVLYEQYRLEVINVARSRRKHRHLQYPLALTPNTLFYLNHGINDHEFDELWVKTFLTGRNTGERDRFWLTISGWDFI
ncbi:MAG TPA: hypothetical protein VIL83_08015 [Capillibacterium sp.]